LFLWSSNSILCLCFCCSEEERKCLIKVPKKPQDLTLQNCVSRIFFLCLVFIIFACLAISSKQRMVILMHETYAWAARASRQNITQTQYLLLSLQWNLVWGFWVLEFVVKRISLAPEFVATEILERLRSTNYCSISHRAGEGEVCYRQTQPGTPGFRLTGPGVGGGGRRGLLQTDPTRHSRIST